LKILKQGETYDEGVTELWYPEDTAKEITSMVMEFIEWMHDNTDDTRVKNDKLWWVIPMESYVYIENVFEYWIKNINKN
jgi:hypothetical protein